MICHKFDNSSLFLTLQIIYENSEESQKLSEDSQVKNVIEKLQEKINELSMIHNPIADFSNRHPWGKVRISISRIVNFPY